MAEQQLPAISTSVGQTISCGGYGLKYASPFTDPNSAGTPGTDALAAVQVIGTFIYSDSGYWIPLVFILGPAGSSVKFKSWVLNYLY